MIPAIIAAIAMTAGFLAQGTGSAAATPDKTAAQNEAQAEPASPYVLGHTMNRIDGTPEKLADHKGKVILMVNTASRCGYTPQYANLEEIYRKYKEEGFVVMGFPANNFGAQEPRSNPEIANFCNTRYDVTFPMFEKINVTGDDTHPLYKQLAAQPEPIGGAPRWNFTKFLINREGHVVERIGPNTRPNEEKVTTRIEELLKSG